LSQERELAPFVADSNEFRNVSHNSSVDSTTQSRRKPVWIWPVLLLWGGLVLSGFALLEKYQNTPGAAAAPPQRIAESPKPKLYLFLHPECPCSHATVAELARLVTACGPRLSVKALVFTPAHPTKGWSEGLAKDAAAIPGVEVVSDTDGRECQRLGAKTSGQVVLYSPEGRLLFSGGITASRGHEGDNDGRDTITDYVLNGRVDRSSTPVFGCSFGFPEATH